MLRRVPVKFYVVVYPSESKDVGTYTAHCLNMDVLADDNSVEGAVSKLLSTVEATLEFAASHNANPFRDAPAEYWELLGKARHLPTTLMERIVTSANRRPDAKKRLINVAEDCEVREILVLAPT
jgi:hypothetical protein